MEEYQEKEAGGQTEIILWRCGGFGGAGAGELGGRGGARVCTLAFTLFPRFLFKLCRKSSCIFLNLF